MKSEELFGKRVSSKDGLRSYCNECRRLESKLYRQNNKDKRRETVRKYNLKNKDIINEKSIIRSLKDPEKRKEISNKSYHKNKHNPERVKYRKDYRKNNKSKRSEYEKHLKNVNVLYRLSHSCRVRVINFLKVKNIQKNNKTFDIIGCSPQFLKEYLENKFDEGMSWENRGDWHIDHIIPLSSADDEERVYELCHYSNLQPLWEEDNLKKGSKIL